MRRRPLVYLLILLSFALQSQSLYFPPIEGDEWETVNPESLGWCVDEIDTLISFLEEKDSKAFIILKLYFRER